MKRLEQTAVLLIILCIAWCPLRTPHASARCTSGYGPATPPALFKLIAHRGGIVGNEYGEYDPHGIQAAIDKGYYMLEVDVNMSKDSVLVINHDNTYTRFYNCPDRVRDLTWVQIHKLVAPRGNYHPLSFEELARMCESRIRLMIDIKDEHLPPVFYEKLGALMEKYHLMETAYFINRWSRDYYMGKAKFEFRMTELDEMKRRLAAGEPIANNYFLFDAGNRLTSSAVKWCQAKGITVVPSVNKDHYAFLEDHFKGAQRDIEFLKACGVTEFQIDSWYDTWLQQDK